MYNRIILIGRLVADPELRYTQSAVAYTRFRIAVDRRYTNKQGERETDFIDIVTWRGLAENCAKFTRKGSLVCVEGSLQINRFENQEGQTVYRAEVVANDVRFLEPKNRSEAALVSSTSRASDDMDDPFASAGKPVDLSDDDLPF